MLEGRAVHKKLTDKDNNPYQAWLQINFKEKEDNGNHKVQRYYPAYGFDLDKAVSKHPIKELADPEQKTALMKSLEKGNLQSVTFQREGREEKMFLEANPKERSVNIYDSEMKKQFQGIKEYTGEKKDLSQAKDEGNTQKQKSAKADVEGGVEKKTKSRRISA